MRLIVILVTIFYLSLPSIVLAHDPYDSAKAPPQLDNEQANWWRCSTPNMRQYLARMYKVPETVAKSHGAHYDNENKEFTPNIPEIPVAALGRPASLNDHPVTLVNFQYKAPPGLSDSQVAAWATADPHFRVRLAEIYKIPKDIAEIYGARY
jgi:hypothetical protein